MTGRSNRWTSRVIAGTLTSVPSALSFLLMMVAGRVHRQQLIVIDFPQAETACSRNGYAESELGLPTPSVPV
jgi:hypothetical protein